MGMGFSRRRTTGDGRSRYTAYYLDLRGRETSAGTFATRREADRAWQRAEAKVAEGRAGTGARGWGSYCLRLPADAVATQRSPCEGSGAPTGEAPRSGAELS
jgi:hypothetical protein